MSRIVNEQELISEIQHSVLDLIEYVKSQVKLGQVADAAGDADSTERGIFSRLLELGLQLMNLYFAGLGDGDAGKEIQVNGVGYHWGVRSPASLLTVFGVVHFTRFLYYRTDGSAKEKSLKVLDARVNLPACQASYFVTDWLSRLGVKYAVYDEAVRFVKDMFGLSMSKRTAERAVTELAASYPVYEEQREAVGLKDEGNLCVVQVDGKGVPIA